VAIFRVSNGLGGSLGKNYNYYEKSYKDELGNAFTADARLRHKLLDAMIDYNRNKYSSAVRKLTELLGKCQKKDDFRAVLMFRALSYTDSGFPANAIEDYKTLLQYDEKYSRAWSNLGILLREEGHFDKAVGAYRNALQYDPSNEFAYSNLANMYLSVHNFDAAIENAIKALNLRSNFYQAANVLAIAYLAKGNEEESRKYYRISVLNGGNEQKLAAALRTIKRGEDLFGDTDNKDS
jgi:tetratricopeptide (TPR) repeat protein